MCAQLKGWIKRPPPRPPVSPFGSQGAWSQFLQTPSLSFSFSNGCSFHGLPGGERSRARLRVCMLARRRAQNRRPTTRSAAASRPFRAFPGPSKTENGSRRPAAPGGPLRTAARGTTRTACQLPPRFFLTPQSEQPRVSRAPIQVLREPRGARPRGSAGEEARRRKGMPGETSEAGLAPAASGGVCAGSVRTAWRLWDPRESGAREISATGKRTRTCRSLYRQIAQTPPGVNSTVP